MERKAAGKCGCGCGEYYYPGTLVPQSKRMDGYIEGHEPELDMTEYEGVASAEAEG